MAGRQMRAERRYGPLTPLSAASVRPERDLAPTTGCGAPVGSIVRPSGDTVPPVEHPECAEGVPAARRACALEIEVDAARVDAVEPPPAVGLPLGLHERYRFCHPGIGVRARVPEVVERTQHVVVPVVRKCELQIGQPDHGPGALAAEQAALKQVFLTAAAGRAHL